MDVGRAILRRLSVSLVIFLILVLALFIFWRSFSNTILVEPFLSYHSIVPIQVQIQNAENYLGIGVPIYLQYFTFLLNIFQGKWAHLIPSISYTVFNTLLLILISFLLGALFSGIMDRVRAIRPLKGTVRIVIYGMAVFLFSLAAPLLIRYITVFSGLQYLLNSGFPAVMLYPYWVNSELLFYTYPILTTSPTHILLIDSIVNQGTLYFYFFSSQMLPLVFSGSLAVAAFLRFMKSRATFRYGLHFGPQQTRKTAKKQPKVEKKYIRMELFGKAGYIVIYTELVVIYNEIVFHYIAGLGFYISLFFNTSPVFSLNDREIWPLSYWVLTFGIITLISWFIFGIYHDFKKSRDESLNKD